MPQSAQTARFLSSDFISLSVVACQTSLQPHWRLYSNCLLSTSCATCLTRTRFSQPLPHGSLLMLSLDGPGDRLLCTGKTSLWDRKVTAGFGHALICTMSIQTASKTPRAFDGVGMHRSAASAFMCIDCLLHFSWYETS